MNIVIFLMIYTVPAVVVTSKVLIEYNKVEEKLINVTNNFNDTEICDSESVRTLLYFPTLINFCFFISFIILLTHFVLLLEDETKYKLEKESIMGLLIFTIIILFILEGVKVIVFILISGERFKGDCFREEMELNEFVSSYDKLVLLEKYFISSYWIFLIIIGASFLKPAINIHLK